MSYDPASFIEGVPVKIVEKYRPPRRVTLPSACNYQVDVEVLTQEYDFITEKETLKWVESCQKKRRMILEHRAKKIEEYEALKEIEKEKRRCEKEEEEEKERKRQAEKESEHSEDAEKSSSSEDAEAKEDTSTPKLEPETDESKGKFSESSSSSEDAEELEKGDLAIANQDIHPEHPKSKNDINDNRTKNGFNYIKELPGFSSGQPLASVDPQSSYAMLVPTLCDPQFSKQNNSIQVNSGINFADFEGDASDPFDNAALKSINDMEELAQVLQSSTINQQNVVEAHNPNYQASSYYHHNKDFNSYFPQSNFPSSSSPYNPPPFQSGTVHTNVTANSVPSTSNSSVQLQPSNYGGAYYPNWNIVEPPISKPHVSYGYEYSQAHSSQNHPQLIRNTAPISHVGAACTSSAYLIGNSLAACNATSSTPSEMMPIGKRQDLEDFYSRYYSFHKPFTNTGARSGENTPTLAHVSSKSLRSCSSVPDLTLNEDTEVSNLTSVNNSFGNSHKILSTNLPQRPSSTGLTEINSPNEQKASVTTPVTPPQEKARLPDPFTELTSDAQSLVQNMSEMGFPRARVARAVQKLGTDHKKLIEVLLTLQSFKDNGEDEYRSEVSFYYYMGDLEKVKEFLSASKQLLGLGFEEEKVVSSLFKFDNDQGKTLEELIT